MNHRPFETWLFEPDDLSANERGRLASHLDGCARCRDLAAALADVEEILRAAPSVAPRAGFTARFTGRLGRVRSSSRRRQTLVSLGAPLLGSLAALAVLVGLSASQLASMANDLMRSALSLWLKVSVLAGFAWSLMENLEPTAFPAVIVWPALVLTLFSVLMYSLFSVVWTALYLRLATGPIRWR